VLNKELYEALGKIFGVVRVHSEDSPCTYVMPNNKQFASAAVWGKKKYVSVEDWGEVYGVCCPVCGDRRHRLYFSHAFGSKIIPKDRKTPIYFPTTLVVCHNERCQTTMEFREYRNKLLDCLQNVPFITATKEVSTPHAKVFTAYTNNLEIPKGCIPLLSERLPGYVTDYLSNRRLDMEELSTKYHVVYAPAGISWVENGETKEFYDDRLLIPIIQSRRLVSWQAREIGNSSKQKYLFHGESNKNRYLYNMDNALLHDHIVVCEGVTDAWRVGEQAVALFGKSLSLTQLELMKRLWGARCSCVVALDSDAADSENDIVELLKKHKVFDLGVTGLRLAENDPDSYSRKAINDKIAAVRLKDLNVKEKEDDGECDSYECGDDSRTGYSGDSYGAECGGFNSEGEEVCAGEAEDVHPEGSGQTNQGGFSEGQASVYREENRQDRSGTKCLDTWGVTKIF
jgi:hypothetical protein